MSLTQEMNFIQPGEHVLVLLPTLTHKLLAKWQAPYPARHRVSPVMYKVDMFDKQKCHQVFHVNMLRKCLAPTALNLWAANGSADDCLQCVLPTLNLAVFCFSENMRFVG